MLKPSEVFKQTRTWKTDPAVRRIVQRYQEWSPEKWATSPEQLSFDIGYLLGLIERLDREHGGGS